MSTENKKQRNLDQEINLGITSLTLENNTCLLQLIFKNYSLKDYFDIFLSEINIPSILSIEQKTSNEKEFLILNSFKNCLLAYEGACYTDLSYVEKQWILLYFLFRDLPSGKDLFLKIHNNIKENKQLPEEFVNDFLNGLKQTKPKSKTDKNSVINDVLSMYLYYSDFRHPSVSLEIKKHQYLMPNTQLSISIDYLFKNLHAIAWKTKWGKIKAFNRNWPEILRKKKQEMVTYYT